MTVKNQRWSDEEFQKERKKVLALWPTGKDVDLDNSGRSEKRSWPSGLRARMLI
jgi:glutamate mutase epsilon subunit